VVVSSQEGGFVSASRGGPIGRTSSADAEASFTGDGLVDSVPVGLGTARLDGRIVAANRPLARILGYEGKDDPIGESLATFHPSPGLVAEVLRERLGDGDLEGFELDAIRIDGVPVRVRVSARPDPADRGVVHFAVEDLTERRPTRHASGQTQKMEAVERFAAGVAHDYNNLLTTIIGEAGQLVEDLPSSDERNESARVILRAAEQAAAITRKLVVFSRSEPARPEVVDLGGVVRSMEGALGPMLGPDVSIVPRLDPDVGPAWIDPSHLRLVIANLVGNASEAMLGGGRVVVETSRMTAPSDSDGLDFHPPVTPGDYVSLAVGDTGEGMSPETRRCIFDPFFTTKPRGEGAGLGLATVYGLVLRANGHLAVISAPGWGTLVRVLLPLHRVRSDPTGPSPHAAAPQPEGPGRQKRVLVVDDEGSVLRVMVKILRRAGYTTIDARDAFEAQDRIRELGAGLDLLVTDVMMPRRTGTELARWLQERLPSIPVLLVSGFADDGLIREWVDADPDIFLPKPFAPDELIARVERRIGATTA
jgi:PAS domain S-box-containing protein